MTVVFVNYINAGVGVDSGPGVTGCVVLDL